MSLETINVIDRARTYVAAIPGAVSGAGGHNQTYRVACALVHGFALPPDEALTLLREYNERCFPPWSEAQLQHKIDSVINGRHSRARGYLLGADCRRLNHSANCSGETQSENRETNVDPWTSTENFLKGFRCEEVDLWEASPIRPPDDWTKDAACLVAMLYEADELVNVVVNYHLDAEGKARPAGAGKSLRRAELIRCVQRGELLSEAGGWLRMNPVDGRGIGDVNVTAFRFALVECDSLPLEMQMPLLARLPLPIAAILTSGGRSLHAWVRVDADTIDEYRQTVARMLMLLARFGVDTRNKNPSRLSRLPGAQRRISAQGDGLQRLLYLNPEPEQKAIL